MALTLRRYVAVFALVVFAGALAARVASAQTPAPSTFASPPVYSASGQAAAVFNGGTVDQLEIAARNVNASGVWAQEANGGFQLFVVDGPAFVNATFRARFASGFNSLVAVTLIAKSSNAPSGPRPVTLSPISSNRWSRPVEAGPYPTSPGDTTLFVAEQDGIISAVNGETVTTILDLRDRVLREGNEEGLLSVALDPGFATNGHVWVYYSAANPRRSVLARFTRLEGVRSLSGGSQLVVLEIPQPFTNHNGGAIRFGADGMLYLGLGDGGSQGDPNGNAQNLGTLLGKIIRIDVRDAKVGSLYVSPPENPFFSTNGARSEIWAYGLRNPWRMAFDATTGSLWAADVGQGNVEEIDIITRGANYGWNVVEGNNCYKPSSGCVRTGFIAPVASYDHSGERCSVSGGLVYRGSAVPELLGHYIYGDFCSGEIWALNAASPGTATRIATGASNVTSFGVDAAGEVLVLSFGQPIRRITR